VPDRCRTDTPDKLRRVGGLDLAELVNQKVHSTLGELNGRVDELVRQAVDDEIGRRVRELVEANLEGRAEAFPTVTVENATKVCTTCSQEKALDRFPPGRNQCRHCRNRAGTESKRRRAAEAPVAPFGGSPAATSPPASPAQSSST
jgi:hypothetical protein